MARTPFAFLVNLCWKHHTIHNKLPPLRRKEYSSFFRAGWAVVASLLKVEKYEAIPEEAKDSTQSRELELFLIEQVKRDASRRLVPFPYLKFEVSMMKVQLTHYLTPGTGRTADFVLDCKDDHHADRRHVLSICPSGPSKERNSSRDCKFSHVIA